jgi:hypothetical protein
MQKATGIRRSTHTDIPSLVNRMTKVKNRRNAMNCCRRKTGWTHLIDFVTQTAVAAAGDTAAVCYDMSAY